MANKINHLDNFRDLYTINFKNEKRSDNGRKLENGNALKMLMWIPIISNVMAVILFNAIRKDKDASTSEKIAAISRGIIAFVVAPLLIPIDLVGTAVKCIIDARNKKTK